MGSWIEAIRERSSTRAFEERPVAPELKQELRELLATNPDGPLGNRPRLELLDFDELERSQVRSLGTYGIITGARLYLVCAIADTREARIDLGYGLERVVLAATQRGLGTCWMGGTFRRSQFAERIGVTPEEIVPVVTPVGYPRARRSLREQVVRRLANADQREPWDKLFFDGHTERSLEPEAAGDLATPLECVRLAPSASNKQPWRIVSSEDGRFLHLFLRRTPGYNELMRGIDLQMVDMGIAMCHLELAARELGLEGSWECRAPGLDAGRTEYIASWRRP